MMKSLVLGAALSLGIAGSAFANLSITNAVGAKAIPTPGNQFKSDLGALGLDVFYDNTDIMATGSGKITFYYVAKETVTRDDFKIGALSFGPTAGLFDPGYAYVNNNFAAPVLIGSLNVNAGDTFTSLGAVFTARNYVTNALIKTATPNTPGFGVFAKGGGATVGNTWYFGFDDQQEAFADDNHDDVIILAQFTSVIPEPAAWAMLLAGFGLTAVALRRRERMAAAA